MYGSVLASETPSIVKTGAVVSAHAEIEIIRYRHVKHINLRGNMLIFPYGIFAKNPLAIVIIIGTSWHHAVRKTALTHVSTER